MKAELFTCEGLTKNSCLSKSYCGWCVENASQFCKSMNACDFTQYNSTNSSSSLVCEVGYHKYRCLFEKVFMVVLIIVLYIVCVFILVDVIKSRMKKLLKAEYISDTFKSTYESLPKYECLQNYNSVNDSVNSVNNSVNSVNDSVNSVNDSVNSVNNSDIEELKDIANEHTGLLINSKKNNDEIISPENIEEIEQMNKLVDAIGNRISFIMFVAVILPTMILYYSNIFLFLVDIFFFIIFVLLICITFR